jgi:hypothetical protein
MRSETPHLRPLEAWHQGERLENHGLDGDEARYHARSGTVLVRKDDTLVTVVDVETAIQPVQDAVLEVLA